MPAAKTFCDTLSADMPTIDLNCDLGEGCGNDEQLLDFVTSANIACGFHAGDATTMRETVEAAIRKNVAIGAHPGFPDRENFGRTSMNLTPQEIFDIVIYQVGAMKAICEAAGGRLHHVKPHGALYNQAAKNKDMSRAIAEAIRAIDSSLILYGGSQSELINEAENVGLNAASEVFADRTYQPDGSLTPRTMPNALITNSQDSINQALQMVETGAVTSLSGDNVPIRAETICLHGDGEHAVEFAVAIRKAFAEHGIEVRPV